MLRLWLAPFAFRGRHVWVGQVSSPLGGRFGEIRLDGSEPPIAPDVDEARNYVIEDLLYSQSLAKAGMVKGVGRVWPSDPRAIPGGGQYHTDGLRAVLLFERGNRSLANVDFFDWERLADHDETPPDTPQAP